MKKLLAMILCALMLTSCFALYAFASEETTAEETTTEGSEETVEHTADRIVFNSELAGKPNCVTGMTGLNKGSGLSKDGSYDGMKIDIKYPEDPNFTVNYQTYCKKYDLERLNGEDVGVIVLKLYVPEDSYYDDIEIFYCAGDVIAPTQDAAITSDYCDESRGFVYFIYNIEGAWSGAINQFRIDPVGLDEGCVMYLLELAMFKTEEDAVAWCDFEEETEPETTEEETTEEDTTEEETTKAPAATTAPAKDDEKKDEGCGSVIGAGIVAFALISLGAVCIKKKD
ncbi:MAG: hypothetical protein IJW70_04965 [Clostridia bacterium]|nr:hypothetical protein [Clostridia bacterium]